MNFDFQCSMITIADLLNKLHESMQLSGNPIIIVHNKVITDTVNYQIRNIDVIEVGVAGLGGGRKWWWKGAQIHLDYPCTLCSVCNKSKPSDLCSPWRGHRNARRPSVHPSIRHKACWRDNFRFPSLIYTQFDPVMHPTILSDHSLPWMSSKMSDLDLLF